MDKGAFTRGNPVINDKKITGTESGLAGYWNFDENSGDTAYDRSLSNHDGYIFGEDGTASSGTLNTLSNTAKSWTADQWAGHKVAITNNTGAGQLRDIVSNTAQTLTVSPDWGTAPASNSNYVITVFDRWCCSEVPIWQVNFVREFTVWSGSARVKPEVSVQMPPLVLRVQCDDGAAGLKLFKAHQVGGK